MKTIPLINKNDAKAAKISAQFVLEVHKALTDFLRAGVTLPEIDSFVGEKLRSLKCKSAFYKYRIPGQPPFPSQSCLSINDCIVHGTHTMTHKSFNKTSVCFGRWAKNNLNPIIKGCIEER